jgi:phosphatidylethanolamine-binding protein (PEBP) family uncharacterized protein
LPRGNQVYLEKLDGVGRPTLGRSRTAGSDVKEAQDGNQQGRGHWNARRRSGAGGAPASARTLTVSVDSFKNGGMMDNKFAFCVPSAQGHTTGGPNLSPSISWSKGPRGTKSYAIILYDTDSPAEQREKMDKEGMTLTAVPRRNFYHWVLVDIPANLVFLKEGADSNARRFTASRRHPRPPACAALMTTPKSQPQTTR